MAKITSSRYRRCRLETIMHGTPRFNPTWRLKTFISSPPHFASPMNLLAFILVSTNILSSCNGNTVTIIDATSMIGYTQLRSCGQEVINSVVSGLHCATNDCMCRLDIMASAIVAINTSTLSSCSDNAIDATSNGDVYQLLQVQQLYSAFACQYCIRSRACR